ncbi:MAG TPA: class I SAM-dependent methyltransferase [Leptolyngbyaceae cyanobacterium M33_DOE_097]|nr:class I SAM-dependent methyltransferase [Leptolyngbyaceae cyanobacterium M33_DOE_097]
MKEFSYSGQELELFSQAHNWKAYFGSMIRPYLGDCVIEVGAGIGQTAKALSRLNDHSEWVCLEPDSNSAKLIQQLIQNQDLPTYCQVAIGTLDNIQQQQSFDSIIYIDVLEHIKDDGWEVQKAKDVLKPGGFLVVLAPAHQWLFTPFDESIGHYRRYTKKTLSRLIPKELHCIKLCYLDCIGLSASLANKLLLRQSTPSLNQILLWDRFMIPISRKIDPLIGFSVGKTVLGIWQKMESSL